MVQSDGSVWWQLPTTPTHPDRLQLPEEAANHLRVGTTARDLKLISAIGSPKQSSLFIVNGKRSLNVNLENLTYRLRLREGDMLSASCMAESPELQLRLQKVRVISMWLLDWGEGRPLEPL